MKKKSKPSHLQIARVAKQQITMLENTQHDIYTRARWKLGLPDTSTVFDYFYNTPNGGHNGLEESLKETK